MLQFCDYLWSGRYFLWSSGGIDKAIADVFADHGPVLGLHQTVIVAVSGTAFGLLDQQLVE